MNVTIESIIVLLFFVSMNLITGCGSQRENWATEEKFFIPLDTIPHRTAKQVAMDDCSDQVAAKNFVIDSLTKANELLHQSLANLQDILIERSLKLEKGTSVILKGVQFEKGKAALTKESQTILEQAYISLVLNPELRVEIVGYTDNTGDPAKNDRLSLERANSVREWLVKRGIDPGRLLTVGKGSREPVATNDTPEGRAANRRIEFHVLD